MNALRTAVSVLLALFALDLVVILVTGTVSLLPGAPVGPHGFAARAAAGALLLVLRFRILARARARIGRARLLLVLLLLPTLMQFQYAGGRINGDGVMYYVYARSLLKDFDLDFTNEYTHYELIGRADLSVPTRTGLRRSIFSIGPALVFSPFFLLGEAVARAEALFGMPVDLSGYGPDHRNAVALGSLLAGFLALLLIHSLLRRYFGATTALVAVLLLWGATFLPWYMVQQPTMSHASSALAAALAVWLWDRDRGRRTWVGFLLLGLVMGLAMCIRWQNGVLLVLPGLELVARRRRDRGAWRETAGVGGLLLLGTLVGASPQMLAWKALYGMWVLPYPPHGTDFVRLDHPFLLQTFFSSRHGLFSWTPVLWAGYLGFLPLVRRRPQVALPLLVPLLLMSYVNVCSGDWWAGGSFSNRRFDSLLPILAFGLAASLDVAHGLVARRPMLVVGAMALSFAAWNLALVAGVRGGLVAADDTVAFPRLVGDAARLFSDRVGFPTTWPASWLFAMREHRPPGQYDLLVGRYLFYRQNNLGGEVELGVIGDEAMLGEGWGPPEAYEGATGRRIQGRARLLAPLDVPEDLQVEVRAAAPSATSVRVRVNGRDLGELSEGTAWDTSAVRAPAALWHRELNDVVLDAGEGSVIVDRVRFTRLRP